MEERFFRDVMNPEVHAKLREEISWQEQRQRAAELMESKLVVHTANPNQRPFESRAERRARERSELKALKRKQPA